jgi:hypothetical protein
MLDLLRVTVEAGRSARRGEAEGGVEWTTCQVFGLTRHPVRLDSGDATWFW